MEHNKRKAARIGNAGYRFRETFWAITRYRKHKNPYWVHSKRNRETYGYSARFELLKIVAAFVLTVSMILLFVLVIHMLI
ncbi:MAG: hypothetical protein M1431_02030 [Candidatus Thermoplasmatota archaeon]|nr:hypothetical protein [Candidatus Thermoplasmatota archaeon]